MKQRLFIVLALLATAAAPAPTWKLTPSGWGPVKIGMTRAEAEKVLHVTLEGEAFDNEGGRCVELYSEEPSLTGLYFMFEDNRLTRITVTEPSAIATPRGARVGSTTDDVRKAYGAGLIAEPHKYEDPPAEYLTFWLKPEKSGVRFETDIQGKVETIHAGLSSIQYVEGCS